MANIGLRKRQFRAAAGVWAILLLVLSLQPHDTVAFFLPREILRNLAHFFAYGILSYLLCFYLRFQREISSLRLKEGTVYPLSLAVTLVWAGLTETVQFLRPDRYPTWEDFLFDVAGALAGLILFALWAHWLKGLGQTKKAF